MTDIDGQNNFPKQPGVNVPVLETGKAFRLPEEQDMPAKFPVSEPEDLQKIVPSVPETPVVKPEIAPEASVAKPEIDKEHELGALDEQIRGVEANLRLIENTFMNIGQQVLESGVFGEEETNAIRDLFANSFNRYEEIATIVAAQLEQIKKIGVAHIKDETPLKLLMEKMGALSQKLSSYQNKNKALLDSLLKIKEVLPEKVADSKPEYTNVVKSSLKAMNDFSVGCLKSVDVDSAPETEKEHLNILFNVYDGQGFADVSKSFIKAEDYYLAETENLKDDKDLLALHQKDKELESAKPTDQHLVDENLRGLFLLKDVFDLNPELYKKVILNLQLLDQYKDDLKDLQPYLKMDTGYYDANHMKKVVLDLAKNDPGMILEYLDNKLEDLQEAYNELMTARAKNKKTLVDGPVGKAEVVVGEGVEEILDVKELEKAAREISQMAQSGEFRSDAEAAARDYADMVVREKFPTEPKMEVGEDADVVDDEIKLESKDIEIVDEVAIPTVKPKIQPPPLPAMKTVEQEEKESAASRAEIAEGIKELKNIKLQRNFVENFWKNNQELSDKLQYYQIMYRELKRLVDAQAGQVVLDDLGQNLLVNLNSYIKENYDKQSEAEIIKAVTEKLSENDEKLQDLYKMFNDSKTVSGAMEIPVAEQVPIPKMAKLEVSEDADVVDEVIELEPEEYILEEDAAPPLPAMQSVEKQELSLSKMIAEAKSFDELSEMIQKNQIVIKGSERLFTTEELLASVNSAKQGIAPQYWQATRNHGFREKLYALYNKQRAKQPATNEAIEMGDEDIVESKSIEPEPILLTKDMMKKKAEPEIISLTEDMKKKPESAVENDAWRKESVLDADENSQVIMSLANKLGSNYRSQKENLNEINAVYTDLSMSLDKPEILEMVQAWFSDNPKYPQYKGKKMSKEAILGFFWSEIVNMGNISSKYQSRGGFFSGGVGRLNFRTAVDTSLVHVNDFVDELNIWQETVYNKNRRPATQLPTTKFPTLFN
jgi:hypothetical protein